MKKFFFVVLIGVAFLGLSTHNAKAQLPDGSIAPNFTVTAYQTSLATEGLDGNGTYTLYDYLDLGYKVIMDVSATWCSPCWSYHTSGILEDLYVAHGPTGFPDVVTTTTNDVMVIWVEGDGTTSDATMLDGAGTIGNWINPTGSAEIPFPMANPASTQANQINNDFNIGYFPTVYRICPNRVVKEMSTSSSATTLYSQCNLCPAAASQAFDPALLSYTGTVVTCGPVAMKVKIQNNGTSPMTSCTVQAKQGTNVINEVTWNGNLATYGTADVDLGSYSISGATTLTFVITSAGDPNTANNTITKSIAYSSLSGTSTNCAINITLDQYASETSWTLTDIANGTVVASNPTYTNYSSAGNYAQAAIDVSLTNGHCYAFEIYDSYGDGFTGSYGNGSYSVTSGGTAIFTDANFTGSYESYAFSIAATGNEINMLENNMMVYPNPAQSVLNISNAGNSQISLFNSLGQEVLTYKSIEDFQQIDISMLPQGTYILRAIRENDIYTTQIAVTR